MNNSTTTNNKLDMNASYPVDTVGMGPFTDLVLKGDKLQDVIDNLKGGDGNCKVLIVYPAVNSRKRKRRNNGTQAVKKPKVPVDPSTFKKTAGEYISMTIDKRSKLVREEAEHFVILLVGELTKDEEALEFPEALLGKNYTYAGALVGGLCGHYFKKTFVKRHTGFSAGILDKLDDDDATLLQDKFKDAKEGAKEDEEVDEEDE